MQMILSQKEMNLKSERDRLKTFKTWSSDSFTNTAWLAAAGFFYFGYKDMVRCAFCNLQLSYWEEDDDPFEEHKKWAFSCPYVNNISPSIELKCEYERLKTFQNWPLPCPNEFCLASAGFYYTGHGDKVKCIFCKIEIENWRENDNPLNDHEKWAPYCPYIRGFYVGNVDLNPENPTIIPHNTSYDTCGSNIC